MKRTWPVLTVCLLLPCGAAPAQFDYLTNGGEITLTKYTGSGRAVAIPNFVTSIGEGAFSNTFAFYAVSIPDSVTNIGNCAFFGSDLTNVTIPNSVTSIGEYAFDTCYGLTNVAIPGSVTNIADGLFDNCNALAKIAIPDRVTSIGDYAFWGCESLRNVTIPNGVTNIGDHAFVFCNALTNVTIPGSVSSIEEYAFSGCESLSDVTIPSGVTNIADGAFSDCSLGGIYFQGNAPAAHSGVFMNDNRASAYYLPGTAGWGTTFDGIPSALWTLPKPAILTAIGAQLAVQSNRFGFTVSWASNATVIVEAATNLAAPVWQPLQTNTVTVSKGAFYFSDSQWTNYPERYYRIRSP